MNDFYSYSLKTYVPLSNAAEDWLTAIYCIERCMRQLTDNHPRAPMNVEQMNAWNLGVAQFIELACLHPYQSGEPRYILGSERSVNSSQDQFEEFIAGAAQ